MKRHPVSAGVGAILLLVCAVRGAGIGDHVRAEMQDARDCAAAAPPIVVSWIRRNAIPVATTRAGATGRDLRPLRRIIGNARVVGLGESVHGVQEFFEVRHRLLRFLVEEMGFTTVRDVGPELAEALNFRAAIRLGVIEGPDIYTTGPLIEGPCGYAPQIGVQLDRPEAAPGLVRALKAQGVDAIKLKAPCMRPEVRRAVMAEARRLGLPVTAHVGSNLTVWDEAVRAGVTGINHVTIYRGDDLSPDPDRPEVVSLLARMAGTGVAMDPTLHVWAVSDARRRELGVEEGERALSRWLMDQRFVKEVVDAGVMLLAGTDNNPSLNDELEDYEAAGVPREVILQSATVNGSKWLGREAEFGTIQTGLRAHFLLVDG